MPAAPTAYQLKRAAIYPRILYGRYRERHQPDFVKRALDLTGYSRHAYGFIGARMEDPAILHDVGAAPGSVVLDVGAYVGAWATAVNDRYPDATIHSFELSPAVTPVLHEAVAGRLGIQVHPYGLGAVDEAVRISRKGLGSSVHNIVEGAQTDPGTVRDIVAVWRELGLTDVAAMKINIEGGEFPLLDRMADTGLLPRVDTYLIQFHEWIRGAYGGRRRIRQHLSHSHRITWEYPFAWERWDRIR